MKKTVNYSDNFYIQINIYLLTFKETDNRLFLDGQTSSLTANKFSFYFLTYTGLNNVMDQNIDVDFIEDIYILRSSESKKVLLFSTLSVFLVFVDSLSII